MTNILVSLWGVIPTNTVAFQQYVLSVMLTQASYFCEKWNLEAPKPLTTNEVTYFFARPRTNSWDATLGINNLYSFTVDNQSFGLFRDRRYHANTFVGNDEAGDALAQKKSCLTLDKSLTVARHAMESIGLKEYVAEKPNKLKQWKYDSNGVFYPLPLYVVRWESKKGSLQLEISGISSNVTEFCNATVAKALRIPLPTNYFALLGLPTNALFTPSHSIKPPDEMFEVIKKPKP